jgi:enoyl-CoA hydratase/carnithine racemase
MFTNARLSAADCERLGLASRVVPDAELAKAAFELARELAAGPPIALRLMKDTLNRAVTDSLESVLDLESERMVQGATTEDYVEAVTAFQEKRPPRFRGR